MPRKILSAILRASAPEIRTTAIAPSPGGVEIAGDRARPGDRILVVCEADGADALVLEVTPAITDAVRARKVDRWIASKRIGLLGMDTPTPSNDWMDCHHILLKRGREIVIVEGLKNLEKLPKQFTFIGFPLNLKGRDGAPCRAVAGRFVVVFVADEADDFALETTAFSMAIASKIFRRDPPPTRSGTTKTAARAM